MVSFWGARKLSSYLMRVKLYPRKRLVGSFKCYGKRCQVRMNVAERDTLLAQLTRKNMNFIIVLTTMTNTLYICSLVISASCNM